MNHRRHLLVHLSLVVLTLGLLAGPSWAQPGGAQPPVGARGGGRFGEGFGAAPGGFGANRLLLLQIEAVQKELKLTPEQISALEKLREELRPMRPEGQAAPGRPNGQRPGGQRPGGNLPAPGRTDDVQLRQLPVDQFFIQNQPEPPAAGARRGNLSPEQLQRFREQMEQRSKREREKLSEILKPEQLKRLNEIVIQVQGAAAVSDPEVAGQLEITEQQKEEITKVRREAVEKNRDELRLLNRSQDREALRKKMTELRQATDDKILGVLTPAQRHKFDALKGSPFELPAEALRPGPAGRVRAQRN